ncbi:MAG: TetR family transcriptional regulator [Ideonella sp.]|nr:TetR family transcriptional regulator [Ideonella sp.]
MRKAGTRGETTWLAIREAAVELIAIHGFEGFNLRELAARCGIKAGSLYNHIDSKEGLLKTLLESIMADLLREFDEQVAVIDDPIEQIRAAVRLHILFHTRRRTEVIIGNTELRSLSPASYQAITALRDRYENNLRQIISKGAARGVFHIPDAKITSFAIIAALTGVGHWYRSNGSLSQKRLIEIHEQLVLQALGVVDETAEATGSEVTRHAATS